MEGVGAHRSVSGVPVALLLDLRSMGMMLLSLGVVSYRPNRRVQAERAWDKRLACIPLAVKVHCQVSCHIRHCLTPSSAVSAHDRGMYMYMRCNL